MGYRLFEIQRDNSISASEEVILDLPVDPLGSVLLNIDALNESAQGSLANFLAALSTVEILYRGQAIVSMSGGQLAAFNHLVHGIQPVGYNQINTDNATRNLVIPVCLGRGVYDATWCFPMTRRGELQLRLVFAASFTAIDTLVLSIACLTWPGVQPSGYMKYSPLVSTPSATGQFDVILPTGAHHLGYVVQSTTVPTATARTTTVDRAALLVDNAERIIQDVRWEFLAALPRLALPGLHSWSQHLHLENTGASYTQNADTAGAEMNDYLFDDFTLIDLDPTRSGLGAFDTRGLSSLKLQIEAGDTSAIRVIPLEWLPAA